MTGYYQFYVSAVSPQVFPKKDNKVKSAQEAGAGILKRMHQDSFNTLLSEPPMREDSLTTNATNIIFRFRPGRLRDEDFSSKELQKVIPAFLEASDEKVILDFSKTEFLDETIFGQLLALQKGLRSQGVKLELHNLQREVKEKFECTKLNTLFTIK